MLMKKKKKVLYQDDVKFDDRCFPETPVYTLYMHLCMHLHSVHVFPALLS